MKKILYIDTSSPYSNIMLISGSEIMACKNTVEINAHAQNINVHIQEILVETDTLWIDLHAIAVMNGPGSYTGLRIGLASAKGFCYAHNIPLILVNRFQLMNRSHAGNFIKGYLLKARENEYYFQAYSAENREIDEATIYSSEEIMNLKKQNGMALFTDDLDLFAFFDEISIIAYNSLMIQELINDHLLEHHFVDLMHSEPFYIKNVHINKINKL